MTGTSTRFPVRRTAHYREERRIRIMGMVRSGLAYEAIAQEENLSRERIRQIVTQSLQAGDELTRVDQNRLQMARLEPALRLAARGVEEGRLQAISPLLKVLQQLDKYGAVVAMAASDTVGMHERLMKKINGIVARIGSPYVDATAEAGAEDSAAAGSAAAPEDPQERKNLEAVKLGWTDL